MLARYFMFTQVYFHKTRVAYDCHIRRALRSMLPGGTFPPPTAAGLEDYLRWDDWKVLGLLADGQGGPDGRRLCGRDHVREVYHTPEAPTADERAVLDGVRRALGPLVAEAEPSKTSTYKPAAEADILVEDESEPRRVRPLSYHSAVIDQLKRVKLDITRLYAAPEHAAEARSRVAQLETT